MAIDLITLWNLGVTIKTFSHPATKLNYPAITVCRNIPYNPDEYVRSVFDNFQLACNDSCVDSCAGSCEETELLRQDFESYLNLVRIPSSLLFLCLKCPIKSMNMFRLLRPIIIMLMIIICGTVNMDFWAK